jgi:CheY-like chemotaxis protein
MAQDTRQTGEAQRLLLVDDDEESVALLAESLKKAGHHVEVATDPSSALELAASFKPVVAIVDIGLPEMSGYELAQELRALCGCKLIAVSGYARDSAPRDTAVSSFDQHLIKPVDAADLVRAIARMTSSPKPA